MAKSSGRGAQSEGPKENFSERFPGGVPLHGAGEMFKWEKVGQELVGTFLLVKPFKKGHIGQIETAEGRVDFSAPTILADILKGIKRGDRVAIVFSGQRVNPKRGPKGEALNDIKEFEVYGLPDDASEGEE